jgi:hypothetical protein
MARVSEVHYFFPPASAYALNRFLFALKSDGAVRASYLGDPDGVMRERGLDEATRAAVRGFERDRLVGLGAHPYLVFMAQVRLSMERNAEGFEYF